MHNTFRYALLSSAIVLSVFGCSSGSDGDSPAPEAPQPVASERDIELHALLDTLKMTGDPRLSDVPSVDSPLAQLGMKLFFSKSLSGSFDTACASCHHPALGGGDDLSLPVGVAAVNVDVLGPGREHRGGIPLVGRNSPTTFNNALYQSQVFHDGRVSRVEGVGIVTPDSGSQETADPNAGDDLLAAQSRFPVVTDQEMRSPGFMAGASNEAVRAHLAARIGDFFSNEEFEVVAVPQIGPGKGDPDMGDLGRAQIAGEGFEYKFRNSSLLNIEVTGPYGHAGAYDSLEDIVLQYSDTGGLVVEYFEEGGWCQLAQFAETAPDGHQLNGISMDGEPL